MGIPWKHWQAPPVQLGSLNVNRISPSSSSNYSTNLDLKDVVHDYVGQATNYEDRLAEPVELDTISRYAHSRDLQPVIIAVLAERLGKGWPWNFKALDIISHLQRHVNLPALPQLLTHIERLYNSPPDTPHGTALHLRTKAGQILTGWGLQPSVPDYGGMDSWRLAAGETGVEHSRTWNYGMEGWRR